MIIVSFGFCLLSFDVLCGIIVCLLVAILLWFVTLVGFVFCLLILLRFAVVL